MSQPKALRHAQELDRRGLPEEATELRRLHDLLGKANALCRIRAAEIERLKAENTLLHERHHFDNGVLKELLEALKDMVEHGDATAFAKARAAIAKAETQS